MAKSANQSSEASMQEVDFVIVTALPEERDAVLAKLPGYKRLDPTSSDIRIYYLANVPVTFPSGNTGAYRVIVMPLFGMGRVEATTATSDAIHRWEPRYVILAGIAGGISKKGVHLGDILLANQIVDYELQKLESPQREVRWKVYNIDPRFLGAVSNFDNKWQNLINVARPEDGILEHHIGSILSGDKVIADASILTEYTDMWSKLIGVEMEAGGVACTSLQAADAPGFFMVRGVSDLADKEKDSDEVKKWRQYACDVAASYTIALLKSGPVPLSDEINKNVFDDKPLSMPNPFVNGHPVISDEFVNRDKELRTVFNRIRHGESTAILGEPNIGKTSFLLRLADKKAQLHYLDADVQGLVFTYLDLHYIDNDFSPAVFWEKAIEPLRKLSYEADIALLLEQFARVGYAGESLERFFKHLGEHDQKLIFALDEFELLLNHPRFQEFAFYATLRAITKYGSCSVILASRISLDEIRERVSKMHLSSGSPVFNHFTELRLQPFEDKDIDAILDRAGDIYSSKDREFIRLIAGHHPYLIQTIAKNLWETTGKFRYKKVAENLCDLTHSHFDELWRTLQNQERTTLIVLGLVECGKCKPGHEFDFGEIEGLNKLGARLRDLQKLGLANRISEDPRPYGKCLIWQGEQWTLRTRAFVCWAYEVAISETHILPAYREWLENKGYTSLLEPGQWEGLLETVHSSVGQSICDIGLTIEKKFN
jgi:nucleoside phosphorylase